MQYIIIDDEIQWRDKAKDVIGRFNNNQTIQNVLIQKFGQQIQLKLLLEARSFNNNVINDLNEADIVFMDIRLDNNNVPTGLNHLQNSHPHLHRKIVILTNFTGEYEDRKNDFPQVLEWLNKPLRTKDLENIVDRTHIRMNNLAAVYHNEFVEFVANGLQIPYHDINYIFTGGGEVTLVYTNGTRHPYPANLLRLRDFKERGGLRQVNNSFIVNIEHKINSVYWWHIFYDNGKPRVTHQGAMLAEIAERNGVTQNYLPIIGDMAKRP